jgi:hypothetical protein
VFALAALTAAACAAEPRPRASGTSSFGFDLSCPEQTLSPAPLRRLTRFEYENALHDIFGDVRGLHELFPRDELALGFDNQGGALGLTDLHVEGYLEAGDAIAAWLLADAGRFASISGCSAPSRACAEELTARLGQRLMRRSLSAEEQASYLALFEADWSERGFASGVSKLVAAMLQSPEFVYRFERGGREPGGSAPAPAVLPERPFASPWVLASRLSFLIWGSVPDVALLEAAAEGRLASARDVEREARRLLADARARRGVLHFYLQWLKLTTFSEVEKDRRLFTRWDDELHAGLAAETQRFLEAVLWEQDARFETLLTAPYSFTNAQLSDFYELPIADAEAVELARVDFAPGVPRLGILTQASILSTQAKANQTDPIHRGKFIREQFLCTTPPPPPPNLVVSPPLLDLRKTTRERFEQHRADPACASCHQLLDTLGFAFEHYDAAGRYRDSENGVPIDASGYVHQTDVDGPIDGVPDLVRKLLASERVQSCMITQLFRYAFGRGETESDACTLDHLGRVFSETRGDLAEVLIALTQTDPFLYSAPAPAEEEAL